MKVLFYSQQCQHSKNTVIAIQKTSLQDDIKMFCIDGFQPLPTYLTHVPTLKIYSPKEQLLIGPEIIEWLEQHKPKEAIQDQIASSSGAYTMLDGNDPIENTIDMAYNSRISTPQGQIPLKEGGSDKNQGPNFPQNENIQTTAGLDMAYEQMVAERNYGNSATGIARI